MLTPRRRRRQPRAYCHGLSVGVGHAHFDADSPAAVTVMPSAFSPSLSPMITMDSSARLDCVVRSGRRRQPQRPTRCDAHADTVILVFEARPHAHPHGLSVGVGHAHNDADKPQLHAHGDAHVDVGFVATSSAWTTISATWPRSRRLRRRSRPRRLRPSRRGDIDTVCRRRCLRPPALRPRRARLHRLALTAPCVNDDAVSLSSTHCDAHSDTGMHIDAVDVGPVLTTTPAVPPRRRTPCVDDSRPRCRQRQLASTAPYLDGDAVYVSSMYL
jgi:hypothetical protein